MKRWSLLTSQVGMSLRYSRQLRDTPESERLGLPLLRWWNLPSCWIRGHRFSGSTFEISPYRLEFCRRCHEEVAGRTVWSQIEVRPIDDDDLPWDWNDADDDR